MTTLGLKMVFRSAVIFSASMLLIACGGGVTGDKNNFVVVDDQTVLYLDQITLSKASIDQTVCVVIYDSILRVDDVVVIGDTVIGELTLEPGEYDEDDNVIVSLQRDSEDQESMFVELHEDACAGDKGSLVTSDVVITQDAVSAVQFIVTRSTTPFVKVSGQSIRNIFNVTKVVADQPSWLVVHVYDATADNMLGDIAGYQLVDAGHESNVSIALREGLENQEELIVALYANTNEISEEDFLPQEDVLNISTITQKVDVEISYSTNTNACDSCVHFSLESVGISAYKWSGDSAAQNKIESNTAGNETISLTVDERYEINNPAVAYHPFELINSDTQEILLSQSSGVVGTFENSSNVNWTDNYGVMTFTLTSELADQLNQYQCSVHPAMAGNIVIVNN